MAPPQNFQIKNVIKFTAFATQGRHAELMKVKFDLVGTRGLRVHCSARNLA